MKALIKDPLNIIIAGVGGQGNLRVAEIIGNALLGEGYQVVIGDTLGGAQRGGSVTSQIRVSMAVQYGPFIPEGQADVILGMEPIETLRALARYGFPGTSVLTSTRPISSVDLFGKRANYPPVDIIMKHIRELAGRVWFIDAVGEAIAIGKSVYANMILIGALLGTGLMPVEDGSIEKQLLELYGSEAENNLMAFNKGRDMITK